MRAARPSPACCTPWPRFMGRVRPSTPARPGSTAATDGSSRRATFSDTPYNAPQCALGRIIARALRRSGQRTAFLARHGITYTFDYIGEAFRQCHGRCEARRPVRGSARPAGDSRPGATGWPGTHGAPTPTATRSTGAACRPSTSTTSWLYPASRPWPRPAFSRSTPSTSFPGGAGSVRIGQLAADSEFLRSRYAGLFVNATFSWPGIASANLPSGGPAFVLATPGARVEWRRARPSDARGGLQRQPVSRAASASPAHRRHGFGVPGAGSTLRHRRGLLDYGKALDRLSRHREGRRLDAFRPLRRPALWTRMLVARRPRGRGRSAAPPR